MSTYRPSREEFVRLAASYRVVPVWREVLADLETPLSVYTKLRGNRPSFLLESAEHGERWGRHSFVGVDPFLILRGKDGAVAWEGEPPARAKEAKGPLEALDAAVQGLAAPPLEHLPPLHGGAVGYIGWEAVREIERVPATTEDDLGLPDVLMLFPRHVVAFDHLRQTLTVATNVVVGPEPEAQYDEAVVANDGIVARLAAATRSRPVSPPAPRPVDDVPSNLEPGEYERMVEEALEHIAAGDVFQVVPSQRFALHTTASPFDVYRMLRVINPS
ncbi:MAG: chorismate-binding protein, partial [Actinomycetota bacterium]|nr:chorismate-binding protein [Actinomycetota bacterium]